MTRAFVTGANGFIGSHLASLLLREGLEVVGLVRTTSDLRRLDGLFGQFPGRLKLVVGDLRDPATLRAGLDGVDYVFHLGAVIMGTSEAEFRESIVDGTGNLLKAVSQARTDRFKRLVHVSSLAAAGPGPTEAPLTEKDPPRPMSWYGTAKRDAEELVRTSGLPFTIVRPSAVFGETEVDLARGTFGAVRSGLVPQVGFGRRTASFVYAGDVARAMLDCTKSTRTLGQTYFLAYPDPATPRDFPRAVAKAFGTPVRIPISIPGFLVAGAARLAELAQAFVGGRAMLTRDKAREVQQRFWACSPAAAEADFGWRPSVSLDEGAKRQVDAWRESRRRENPAFTEPAGRRALKTYAIVFLIGMLIDTLGLRLGWYRFHAPWPRALDLPVLAGFWLLVMGSVAFLTARLSSLGQLVVGAVVFASTELANALRLDWWTMNPTGPLGRIPGPWLRALVLGVAVGVLTVVVPNAIVGALHRRRLRTG